MADATGGGAVGSTHTPDDRRTVEEKDPPPAAAPVSPATVTSRVPAATATSVSSAAPVAPNDTTVEVILQVSLSPAVMAAAGGVKVSPADIVAAFTALVGG